jgi:hypothetical protein
MRWLPTQSRLTHQYHLSDPLTQEIYMHIENTYPLFVNLKILPLRSLFFYEALRIFYRRSGNFPAINVSDHDYQLRRRNILLPKPNFTLFKRSFLYVGPKVFNYLPDDIKAIKNTCTLLNRCKMWLSANNITEEILT